jgi:hypothetical protein
MKKNLFKSITLALALSIMPMTALHAMNETNPQTAATSPDANNNQNIENQQRFSMVDILGGCGLMAANIAIHEAGHALMASLIKPGSVEKISIIQPEGTFVTINHTGMSRLERAAIAAAGPLLGGAFSYGYAQGLQALNTRLKKKNELNRALMEHTSQPDTLSISIDALGNAADYAVCANMFNLFAIPGVTSDGGNMLLDIFSAPEKVPLSLRASAYFVSIPLWNLAIFKSIQAYVSRFSYKPYKKITLQEDTTEPSHNRNSDDQPIRNPLNAFHKAAKNPLLKDILPKFY